ncbi:MAG: transposase [Thermoleophilaceae bacterium]
MAMETYVRLMVVKQRSGWGYETLLREVSDSLHLRRFCLIGIDRRVPDESTVRKLTRRLGAETVNEITRAGDRQGAARDQRFVGRAVRVDSTVIEADVRYPSDAMLALQGTRALAREGAKLAGMLKTSAERRCATARARWARAVRAISRTLARRTGRGQGAGDRAQQPRRRADRALGARGAQARRPGQAGGARPGARAKLRAAAKLEELAGRCEKVAEQIARRARGQKISDRLVSIFDPDARPIRKGKLGKMTEFGYVAQIAEVTPNTRRGARGFVLPAATAPGNPGENTLLPDTMTELRRLGIRPRELVGDGGFQPGPTREALPAGTRLFLSGRHEPGSRRTRKRQARYRTGCEGRISHLKRRYGLRRSRLKGHDGQQTWTGWAILAYNLETYHHYAA